MENFTQQELYTLSNSILALIRDAGEAKKLVNSRKTHAAIDKELEELQALNSKVCGMMKD